MLTAWEAARPRILPSLGTLAVTMAVWAIPAAGFFWEPLIIWHMFHGQPGIGHFDGGSFTWGLASWLVPVFIVEVLGLITDITSVAGRYGRYHDEAAHMPPSQYYAAYSLRAPLRDYYIQDFKQFCKDCMEPFWMKGAAVIAAMVWAIASLYALALMSPHKDSFDLSPEHLLYGFGAATLIAWATVAFMVTTFTGTRMCESNGSILSLPWRQGWAQLYALVVLPMAPLYGVAAVRLAVAPEWQPQEKNSAAP